MTFASHAPGTEPPDGFGPWIFCSRPAGAVAHPDKLDGTDVGWLPALVPGTVASSLAQAGRWKIDQPLDGDDHDWWYRTTFAGDSAHALTFDGLAALAEIWINGEKLLATDNMFRSYRVDLPRNLNPVNSLVICFRSLTRALQSRRPRPRWKTQLVANQQLRWMRTSLQGRIPGWSPPIPPVGPWRAIHLEREEVSLTDIQVTTVCHKHQGLLRIDAKVRSAIPIRKATLLLGGLSVELAVVAGRLQGEVELRDPPRWWPHTHGGQPLLSCAVVVETQTFDLGKIGFRTIEASNPWGLCVNGEPIYARGACWTVSDIVNLTGTPESLRQDLGLARDAGVNLLRVVGPMVYECDEFYRICDELGILVWQDFMFANMDYPVEDPVFAANIEAEAREQLARLARHPSVAVYCGNSEVEQQAAMVGTPENLWRNSWFGQKLPQLCAELHPGSIYVPSSPSGGALPFHVREGVAHYYGIGAYQRTPADLRKDDVGFSAECLGFANIPESSTLNFLGNGETPPLHHPRWKQRVPRDMGPGWDFDDVRDFYLRYLFDVDPVRLRSFGPDRYLKLSRVVPGEMMAAAFSEWRSVHSRNRGGLVWFFKDLWPGAGWGIVDSRGLPKASYYALRRTWQTRQVVITDEGLEGLHLHAINESNQEFAGTIELALLKHGQVVVAQQQTSCNLAPRSREMFPAVAILGGFYDTTYAYRFGPPSFDVAIATLLDADGKSVSESYHFLNRCEPMPTIGAAVRAEAKAFADGFEVALESDRLLQHVSFDVDDFLPEDNYFHLSPLRPKMVRFKARTQGAKWSGYVDALNLPHPIKILQRESAE